MTCQKATALLMGEKKTFRRIGHQKAQGKKINQRLPLCCAVISSEIKIHFAGKLAKTRDVKGKVKQQYFKALIFWS